MPRSTDQLLQRAFDDVLRAARDPAALKAGTSQLQALVHTWRQLYQQNASAARLTPEQFEALLEWLGGQPPAERMSFASRWRATGVAPGGSTTEQLQRMGELLGNITKTRSEISMTFARNARA